MRIPFRHTTSPGGVVRLNADQADAATRTPAPGYVPHVPALIVQCGLTCKAFFFAQEVTNRERPITPLLQQGTAFAFTRAIQTLNVR